MVETTRYAPWAVLGVGAAVLIWNDLVAPSRQVRLALSLGGAAVMLLGIVWADIRSTHGCLVDERHAEIHHRSGYFGFVVMGGLAMTGALLLVETGLAVSPTELLLTVALLGLVAYRGSVAWYKRTM